jgi:Uma2 family endonuclease
MTLITELPDRQKLLAMNRRRWQEVIADRELARLPYRIETNAHGQLIMTPPPSGMHSDRQTRILLEIHKRLAGHPLAECPISTIDGVRAADVGWYSTVRYEQVRGQVAFEIAPEICVEVVSPSNTESELQEKRQLYFEAGAEEVWMCGLDGTVAFYLRGTPSDRSATSRRCPDFPSQID